MAVLVTGGCGYIGSYVVIPYEFSDRRKDDLPEFWADVSKAEKYLGWKAKRGLKDMIIDSWNWQNKKPCGYV